MAALRLAALLACSAIAGAARAEAPLGGETDPEAVGGGQAATGARVEESAVVDIFLEGDYPADDGTLEPSGLDLGIGFESDLSDYSAWDSAMVNAAAQADADSPLAEPVTVPEPSALAMFAGLIVLLLAMTILRWHFDRSTATANASS